MDDAAQRRQWVERAKGGDRAAFMALLGPELPGLHQVAYYLARDADEASDLAQTACVRAFVAFGRFDPEAPLRPWLQRILRNIFLDRRKSARARHEVAEPAPDEGGPAAVGDGSASALDVMLRRERQVQLTEHIRALPPDFGAVLVLSDIQGHSYQEVGEILSLPLGTVKSRLSRARALLRDRLLAAGEPYAGLTRKERRGPR